MIVTHSKLWKLAEANTVMGPFKLLVQDGKIILNYGSQDIEIKTDSFTQPSTVALKTLVKTHTKVVLNDYAVGRHAVDALYNFFVDTVTKRGGAIKESAKTELRSRCMNETAYTNHFIQKMQAAGYPVQDIRGIKSIFNYTTGLPYYFAYWHWSEINTESQATPRGIDLADLGYIKDPASSAYWRPDEPMEDYEGMPYRASQLVPCTECSTRAPNLYHGLCSRCLGIDPALVVIRGYSDRAPSFMDYKLGKYSTSLYKLPLYFGIEIEYESSNQEKALLDTARLLGNHAIFKRDGSIRDGFEIVTTPATLDHQKDAFKRFFDKFPSTLLAASNTGMHIHISRNPLSMLTQGKLVEFMNREDNKAFIENVAGRPNNNYTRQDTRRGITYPFLNTQGERYNTLNINNRETLEFRIFSSPISWEQFEPRIEFVDALTAYCSPCQAKGSSIKDVTHHTGFIEYVKQHATTWKALATFLGLTKPTESQARYKAYQQLKLSRGIA